MNFLIIEDDEAVALSISVLLRTLGNSIEIVGTMRDALAAITRKPRFDIVLLDLALPDSSAGTSLDMIPELKQGGAKVVVISGSPPERIEPEAMARGAEGCCYKGNSAFAECIRAKCGFRPDSKSPFGRGMSLGLRA